MNELKHKKDVSHLKQYQWKKGYRPPGSGTRKGTRRWSTELTLELLCDAALIDPETGKRMSAKSLKRRLSKHIWSDARILLNYLDRKLGKVADKVEGQVSIVFKGLQDPNAQDDQPIIDGQIVVPELPTPDDDEQVDDK